MKARLEIEGHFFRYMPIYTMIEEIHIPIPRFKCDYKTNNKSKLEKPQFIELIFTFCGYSEIDGNRTYKLAGFI